MVLCELIPKVCEYYQTYEYNDLFLLRPNSFGSSIIPIEDKVKLIPIKDIANSWELRQYLDIIQVWLMHYGVKVPSKLLQSFFSVCIDFSHDLDPTRIAPKDVEYIWGKISCIDLRKNRNKFGSHNSQRQWNYSDVLDFFDEQMSVMREIEYIDSSDADLFLRAFTTILSRGHLDFTQSHLNRIKHALQPIWELCRFEERFVTPQWGWNGFFYEK